MILWVGFDYGEIKIQQFFDDWAIEPNEVLIDLLRKCSEIPVMI